MPHSAGILLFRQSPHGTQVLLGHMGGPFWARRDDHAWSIPKGEAEPDETLIQAAYREFSEELGLPVPTGHAEPLGDAKQSNGKIVTIWAVEGDLDVDEVSPGTFDLEWPRGSGRIEQFPEIDRAAWFDLDTARIKLVKGQLTFIDRLIDGT
jgi:predicted NUDIX family NTP pyrophosphohydrolase